MAGRKLLLIGGLVLFAAVYPSGFSSAVEGTQTCVGWGASGGQCEPPPPASGEFNNGGVDLSAGVGGGGSGGGGTGGGGNNNAGNDGTGGGPGVVVDEGGLQGGAPVEGGTLPIVRDGFTVNCAPGSPCDPNLVVRMSDLVNIKPADAEREMEPSGWAVVGLPANFIARASPHVRSGLLLGFPADVRFTPAGYRWDYGDGARRTTRSGGETWAALGLPEFSETATSHTYATSGTYEITAAVVYTAEYRFAGQEWRDVAGTLVDPSPPISAVVGEARTVLVDKECTRNPGGPGC